ncbi:hypothetical protein A2V68_01520 [candidate division Kazan bacterium RBG_13_50_9]|uniref:ZIP zinc transporter n=1 Tax=candidate division Kazan bacterium RBG_13_50_9 TaxID=1798535 RepID=A0A1F4NRE4_UNCK3|nr:MAG: hypothetical protein A2V68_01520 [candidate division Kazan bacterium RBG_13_50_9]
MDPILLYIIASVTVVSLISLLGVLYFILSPRWFDRALPWLVAFAAGALLGVSFFDLIPESFGYLDDKAPVYVVGGIVLFLLFEQVLHWHHEHRHDCEDCGSRKTVGYTVLLGDGLHNFLDGILLASAFLTNVGLGLAATVAVVLHEIPQELGDFAVLVHSGFSRYRALLFNFLSALTAVVGGLLAYFFLQKAEGVVPYIIAIGAGGFLYIALVDLVAELKGHQSLSVRLGQLAALIIGLLILFTVVASHPR